MRLVLVLLATFLQSLFDFLNLQNLIGWYAFNNIHRRQMLPIAAVHRHRRRQRRRRNQRWRYWCLPQSWFETHYNTSGGSRGRGPGVLGPPLFWVKKEEMTEGKMADRASKSRPPPPPPPPLAQGLDSATEYR